MRPICRRGFDIFSGRRQFGRRQTFRKLGQRYFQLPHRAGPADYEICRRSRLHRAELYRQLAAAGDRFALERDDGVAGRNARRGRGTVGIHVADGHTVLFAGPHGEDAEEAVLKGLEFRGQFELALDALLAAQHGHVHRLAGVAAVDFLFHLDRAGDGSIVDLDDPIAGLQAGNGGGTILAARGNDRRAGIRIRPFQAKPGPAGIKVLALPPLGEDCQHLFHRDGEADAGIVPFDACHFVGGFGRQRHQHAENAAADIDQRAAVVVGRDGRVGLDCLTPNAVERLRMPTAMLGRSLSKVRPTAMAHWPTRICCQGTLSHNGSGFAASIFSSTSMRE